jgi:hypothetical protein
VELADPSASFFREFALPQPEGITGAEVVSQMADRGFLAGVPLRSVPGGGEGLLVAVTELRLWREIDAYVAAFQDVVARFAVESRT